MPPAMFNTRRLSLAKRELFKFSLGGAEQSNPKIKGNDNHIIFGAESTKVAETTLLRKAGSQVGKILESGTGVVIAPAKWLAHMQENWLTYMVCTTILMVCILLFYCHFRRKTSSIALSSYGAPNLSRMAVDEAIKLATFRRVLQDD